jgi:hypothetical protein
LQATIAPAVAQTGSIPPVPLEPPDAYPRILAVTLSTPVVSGGETVTSSVETSSNVASVEARIGGYSATYQKTGVGRFSLAYKVPRLPFFLHKSYLIQIIARNTAGTGVSTAVPITVR